VGGCGCGRVTPRAGGQGILGMRVRVNPWAVAPWHVDIVKWVLAVFALLRIDEEPIRLRLVDRYRRT